MSEPYPLTGLPGLDDPRVRRALNEAVAAQLRAEREAPEPLACYYTRTALERIEAAAHAVRSGAWVVSQAERAVLRRAFEARSEKVEGLEPPPENLGSWPSERVAAWRAACDAQIAERLGAVLAEQDAGSADRFEHITAYRELMRFTAGEYASRRDERLHRLHTITHPAIAAAGYLWHDIGWPDDYVEL